MKDTHRILYDLRRLANVMAFLTENGAASEEIRAVAAEADEQRRALVSAGQPRPPDGSPVPILAGALDCGSGAVPLAWEFPLSRHIAIVRHEKEHDLASNLIARLLSGLVGSVAPAFEIHLADLKSLGRAFGPILDLRQRPGSPIAATVATDPEGLRRTLAELRAEAEKTVQDFLRGTWQHVGEYLAAGAPHGMVRLRLLCVRGFAPPAEREAKADLEALLRNGIRAGVGLVLEGTPADLKETLETFGDSFDVLGIKNGGQLGVLRLGNAEFRAAGSSGPRVVAEALSQQEVTELAEKLEASVTGRMQAFLYEKVLELAGLSDPRTVFKSSTTECIEIPLGIDQTGRLCAVTLGTASLHHLLVAGRSGSGKSTLLHVLIATAARAYPPSELRMLLADLKGVDFRCYVANRLPHTDVLIANGDREGCLGMLRRLAQECRRRRELFAKAGVKSYTMFRETGEQLPRLLAVIDEFQVLFEEDDDICTEGRALLDKLARESRAFGVHLVLASQSLHGAKLTAATLAQFAVRIALECGDADSRLILAENNPIARTLKGNGDAVLNQSNGQPEDNRRFQCAWLSPGTLERALQFIDGAMAKLHIPVPEEAVICEDALLHDRAASAKYSAAISEPPEPGTIRLIIGESTTLEGVAVAQLRPVPSSHLLIVGGAEKPGLKGLLETISQSLAMQIGVSIRRVIAFDPEGLLPVEAPWDVLDESQVQEALAGLHGGEHTEDGDGVVLLFAGLHRLAFLKWEGFGAPAAAAGTWLNLLQSGPANGVHAVAWVPALSQYKLIDPSSKGLVHYNGRICFAMPEGDSSALLGKRWATGLPDNIAIWCEMDNPRQQKIRPYAPDDYIP